MYLWILSNSDLTRELVLGRNERADAMARAAYRITSGVTGAASWLLDLAERAGEAAGRWRRRRAAISTLQSLNDRLLRDIGIDRSEILRVVDETADSGPLSIPEVAQLEARRVAPAPEPIEDLRKAA